MNTREWLFDASFGESFRAFASRMEAPYAIYVQTIDSIDDPALVLQTLKFHGVVAASAQVPIIGPNEVRHVDLDDERVFGAYSVIWAVREGAEAIEPPAFDLLYAAEEVDRHPLDRITNLPLAAWDPVWDWMAMNEAYFGVASARFKLVVSGV